MIIVVIVIAAMTVIIIVVIRTALLARVLVDPIHHDAGDLLAVGIHHHHVIVAGDAAGLADPLTGEGISAAIESGGLAARAILDGAGDPARMAESYERALAGLRRELRIGRVLAHLTYHRPRVRRWIFRKSGQMLSDVMTDVMLGDRTYAEVVRRAGPYALRRAIGARCAACRRYSGPPSRRPWSVASAMRHICACATRVSASRRGGSVP